MPRVVASGSSGAIASAAISARSTSAQVQVRGPGIGPGEREQVVHEGAQPHRLAVDRIQRPADLRHAGVRLLADARHARADDRERRAELVARVGGELALALERGPDRDERARGVQLADGGGREQRQEAADQQHHQQDAERPQLRGPVADDLDDAGGCRSSPGAPSVARAADTGTDSTRTGLPW